MKGILADINATAELARSIAPLCKPGDVITLRGTLGVGKTTFARAFIHALAPDAGEVVSPTFSLLQVYNIKPLPRAGEADSLNERSEFRESGLRRAEAASAAQAGEGVAVIMPSPQPSPLGRGFTELWHLDLYRLKKAEEALELGIEDGFSSAIMLIEWPEVIEPLLPPDRLDITLDYGSTPEERTVLLQANGNWKGRIASL